MFQRLPEARGRSIGFRFDDAEMTGLEGDSVAAALLAAGITRCRTTPVSGAPRGPYCLMGVCFECLVVIDGVGSRQACLVPLRDGMDVRSQLGRREPEL